MPIAQLICETLIKRIRPILHEELIDLWILFHSIDQYYRPFNQLINILSLNWSILYHSINQPIFYHDRCVYNYIAFLSGFLEYLGVPLWAIIAVGCADCQMKKLT